MSLRTTIAQVFRMLDRAEPPTTGMRWLPGKRVISWDKAGAPDQTVVALAERLPDGSIKFLACGTEAEMNAALENIPELP